MLVLFFSHDGMNRALRPLMKITLHALSLHFCQPSIIEAAKIAVNLIYLILQCMQISALTKLFGDRRWQHVQEHLPEVHFWQVISKALPGDLPLAHPML